jgi:hypothetical protein
MNSLQTGNGLKIRATEMAINEERAATSLFTCQLMETFLLEFTFE